jgi:hypothetical protein
MFNWTLILTSAGAGIVYSLTAYAKNNTDEEFDWAKFGTTILIGAGVGVVSALSGMNMTEATQFVVSLGMVPLVENVYKVIVRKVIPWIKEKLKFK